MNEKNNLNKIQKIRTFRDDVLSIRGRSAQTQTPEVPVTPVTPLVVKPNESTESIPPLIKKDPTPITIPAEASGKLSIPKAVISPPNQVNEKKALEKKALLAQKTISETIQSSINPLKQTEDLLASRTGRPLEERISVMDQGNEIEEGSIITDKKRERFHLFPALAEYVKSLFVEGKNTLNKKAKQRQKAIPKVRKTEGREEVVQKAAKQSALAPKDDYRELREKLPTTDKSKSTPTVIIKEKSTVPAPGWSHFEGEVDENETPIEKSSESTKQTKEIPKPEPIVVAPTKTPELEPTVSTPEPIERNVATKSQPTPKPVPVKFVGAKQKKPWHSYIPAYIYMYTLIGLVSITATGIGVSVTWWLFSQRDSTPTGTAVTEDNPILVLSQEQNIIVLTSNRENLFSEIKNLPATGIVTATIQAPTGEIVRALSLRANEQFLNNISGINLGAYNGVPFIILRVQNFDTAFGGILDVEDRIGEDLSGLFGTTGMNGFVDDVIKNHDVRIMKRETGEEIITYGFVNRNTIIITGNSNAFASIAEVTK